MQSNKLLIVVFSTLIARICAAGIIIESPKVNGAIELDKAAVNLITSCYRNQGPAVGIGSKVSEYILKTLSSRLIPVALIDNPLSKVPKYYHYSNKIRYRLQVFVIETSSPMEFEEILAGMKPTVWWDHMASFVILYRSSRGCRRVINVLWEASRLSLLDVKLLCFDREYKTLIHVYNPYGPEAPKPWELVGTFPYKKWTDPVFAVFVRPYKDGTEICKNLNFDTMRNLHSYPIQLVYIAADLPKYSKGSPYVQRYHQVHTNVVEHFIRAVNATGIIVNWYSWMSSEVHIYQDMRYGVIPMGSGRTRPISRPFIETGVLAMTQNRGYMSQLEKIMAIVDIYSRFANCIALIVTLVFFKLYVRQGLAPAALNIVRAVCNTGFANVPEDTPSRLFLTGVLFFVVTMQGIYQGNWASLLTTDVPLRNVDTWQDLIDLGHTVYVPDGSKDIFRQPELEGRIIEVDGNGDCADYVEHDPSAACVSFRVVVMAQAAELNLHVSETLKASLGVYTFRPNWHLEDKLNLILGKIFEADIVVPIGLRKYRKSFGYSNIEEAVEDDNHFRDITLEDLSFAFVILGIGLTCASVVFIFEIVVNRVRSRNRIRHVPFGNWIR